MDANLVEAFKKLEAKLKDDKEKVLRQERAEQLRLKQEILEKERKKQEQKIYVGSVAFLFAIFYSIYLANESQIRESGGVGAWVASKVIPVSAPSTPSSPRKERSSGIDCALPDNWKLAVCLEIRKSEMNSKWQNLSLGKGGKDKPFAFNKN